MQLNLKQTNPRGLFAFIWQHGSGIEGFDNNSFIRVSFSTGFMKTITAKWARPKHEQSTCTQHAQPSSGELARHKKKCHNDFSERSR